MKFYSSMAKLSKIQYKNIKLFGIVFLSSVTYACSPSPGFSQQSSNVTNSAAPYANVSTNATGGTNINQQLNNVYDTSYGFGPGIICRTPQLILNGTYGQASNSINGFPLNTGSNTYTGTYGGTLGFAIPIGSSVISDCQRYAAQIAQDRVISSELSLIRACAQLEREKLVIDPIKYPQLSKCLVASNTKSNASVASPALVPPTNVAPSAVQGTTKLLQRFNP